MVNLLWFGLVNLQRFSLVNFLRVSLVNLPRFGLVNLLKFGFVSFGVIKMSVVNFSSIVKVLIDVENISFHIALEANLG